MPNFSHVTSSDEKKNFKGMFFQDVQMMQAFQSYPEILFIDATYKLIEIGFSDVI